MKRRKPKKPRPPELTAAHILAWADEYHDLYGRWPTIYGRPDGVPGVPGQSWRRLDKALRRGFRGLPGGSSLARLLAARRGVRNGQALPPFTVEQILRWCDDFHARTGEWPHRGMFRTAIPGTNGDTWFAVNSALHNGRRGLPGGSSLARLLAEHRGVRNIQDLPALTVRQVLAWADAHRERTGRWPRLADSRAEIPDGAGETWGTVIAAAATGRRGLPGGSSFWDLLRRYRGRRNIHRLPRLTVRQILSWADAVHTETDAWPTAKGPAQAIPGAPGERWQNVNQALRLGLRGLPGGVTLAGLLARHRGVPNSRARTARAADR